MCNMLIHDDPVNITSDDKRVLELLSLLTEDEKRAALEYIAQLAEDPQ